MNRRETLCDGVVSRRFVLYYPIPTRTEARDLVELLKNVQKAPLKLWRPLKSPLGWIGFVALCIAAAYATQRLLDALEYGFGSLPLTLGEALGVFSIWLALGVVLSQNRRHNDSIWQHVKRRTPAGFVLWVVTSTVLSTLYGDLPGQSAANGSPCAMEQCLTTLRQFLALNLLEITAFLTGFAVGVTQINPPHENELGQGS